MESHNISLTLEKAREWYNSGSADLREVALQAFTEKELKPYDFRQVTSFQNACEVLGIPTGDLSPLGYSLNTMERNVKYTRASIAMIKLNIVRQALNLGHKMNFTTGTIWYPYTPVILPNNSYCKDSCEVEVAKVKIGCDTFTLLSGRAALGSNAGLGSFYSYAGVGDSVADVGFLGCATKEIAQHMGKHFAKLIFEAKYGDTVDYKWV